MMNDLLAAATLGLLGSAHCAGMCGGFYVIAGRKNWVRRLPYLLGKTSTYVALGAVAGSLGSLASMYSRIGSALTVTIGIALIVSGLIWIGWVPRTAIGDKLGQRIGRIVGRVLGRAEHVTPYVLGLANGLLPCGLTMGAVGLAATTANPISAMSMMAVFGLATIPGLAMFGLLVGRFGSALQRRSHVVGGVALMVFGVITVMRAYAVMGHGGH